MEESLRGIKLTRGEINRFTDAFKDPTFCKLFAEYANELNDPENKRRYEEEVRLAEMERGIDVEFINPTPNCVLKSRSWPSLAQEAMNQTDLIDRSKVNAPSTIEGQKIFINICSCDKLEEPTLVPGKNGDKPLWNIPHCFAPPVEDFDKEHKRCVVIDVVFHPRAIDRSKKVNILRKSLHATAIEGVHRQFGYFLGLTRDQAQAAWKSLSPNEAAVLSTSRLLKGLSHKGALRATIIRRKREDFKECQERLAKAEKAAFEEARKAPNSKESLAALCKFKRCMEDSLARIDDPPSKRNDNYQASESTPKYKAPGFKVIHSTEFDILNCANDRNLRSLSSRPSSIKVEVDLPGIEGADCLDLDVTETQLLLQSEKPVAYQLRLDLPYPVYWEQSRPKFIKANHKLIVTLPVVQLPLVNEPGVISQANTSPVPLVEVVTTEVPPEKPEGENANQDDEEESSPSTSPTNPNSFSFSSKKRRKRRRRRGSDPTDSESEVSSPSALRKADDAEPGPPIKLNKLKMSKLVVPKTSSLASVLVRQDLTTFTIILEVRNVLRRSIQLDWSETGCCGVSDALHLMLTCSSRGSGNCTLHFGTVLHCPAPTLSSLDIENRISEESDGHHGEEPLVIDCKVSPSNVAIVLRKPKTLMTWWESVAVGRVLGLGFQEVPIISPVAEITKPSPSEQSVDQLESKFHITHRSPECVHLAYGENPQTEDIEAPMSVKTSSVPSSQSTSSDHQPNVLPSTASRCNSLDSDAALPLRRGILKMRYPSDCSLDGVGLVPFGSSLGGHPGPLICSDDFPSNSEDESVFSPPHPTFEFPIDVSHRSRCSSVNFSKKDENVAFSQYDPVQTLHNAIRNKAKNARRSERRRRHNSFTASSITLNEMQSSGHGANEMNMQHLNQKQRRQLQRKQKHEGYLRHYAATKGNETGAQLDSKEEKKSGKWSTDGAKDVEATKAMATMKERDGGELGTGFWESEELHKNGRGQSSNPHATTCPVTLTANAIFDWDGE